ncbi:MAG: type II secretion system protein [Patescibacteria group bacterium]
MKHLKKGFTLIELLVVIGILAILLAITLIAINPARQFGQANNTRRRSDTLQVLNAIHQYVAENKGNLPAPLLTQVPLTPVPLASTGLDLCNDLMSNYIPALPVDPSLNTDNITDCSVAYDTGYTVSKDAQNRVTVAAPTTDNNEEISVTR